MSGVHDVGGGRGFGPIVIEPNEPPFHAPWEGRMHGIAVTCQVSGLNFTAEQRATIETMSQAAYAQTTYYEKWLWAYEKLLDAKGIVTVGEMEQRIADQAYEDMPAHPKEPANPSEYAVKALFNTRTERHIWVCTLCSCYPWTLLGIPPVWFKSTPFRAKVVSHPREVLADFGLTVGPDVALHVWDTSAEQRYIVIPERPAGTAAMTEEELAALVTRDCMIGTGDPLTPAMAPAECAGQNPTCACRK